MLFLYLLLVLILLFIIYARFETRWLKVNHVRFSDRKDCLKILQLSDIHIHSLNVSHHQIRQVIARENPDLVILTGDYIARTRDIPAFLRFLGTIGDGRPMVGCLGNHEYKAFWGKPAALEQFTRDVGGAGVSLLQNASVVFEKNGKRYNIIGVNDLRYRNHNVQDACRSLDPEAVADIAFSHNPDILFEIPEGKVDYLFCGHFHGGQIWAPFSIEFRLMRREKLCKMGIRQGLHRINGIQLYISRGLGNVFLPLRFLSRPEISVFHID